MTIDATATRDYVQRVWDDSIVPALTEYIRIPAKSPHYDAKWAENGHIDRAVSLLQEWSVKRAIGLPGDVVSYDHGVVRVNDEPFRAELDQKESYGTLTTLAQATNEKSLCEKIPLPHPVFLISAR